MNQNLLLLRGPSRLLLFSWLLLSAFLSVTNAQATLNKKNRDLNLGFYREKITSVFEKIEKETDLNFVYAPSDLSNVPLITIARENRTLQDLLRELSTASGLKFNLRNNLIAVSAQKQVEKNDLKLLNTKKNLADMVVQGIVTDSMKRALPGVSVYVKNNTSIGTSTDLNGRFSLKVPPNAILVFKIVGFTTVEVKANKPEINITLTEDKYLLDDVQIVAFGTTKKESVVGAITTIKPDELKVPSSNLTTALSGRIAGLIAYQRSGEPGADNANFFVRGAATFGYKRDPLILIDGLELTATDLARLQPNDIASFSVLKDATSAAVYGARAANGIILVTTKRGTEGRAKISLEQNFAISQPTQNVELADPVTYMRLHNEAVTTRDPLGVRLYSQNKIDGTAAGLNPYVYPAVDWMDMLLKKSTLNSRTNLSISGGGKVAAYFVTGTMNQDNGILKVDERNNFNSNIKLNSYSIRSNVDVNITNTTKMAVRLYGNFDDYNGPITGGSGVYSNIINSNPALFPAYFAPDENNLYTKHILFGNYENGQYLNPYANMVSGYKDSSRSLMLAQLEIKQDLSKYITEGLKARLMTSTQRRSFFELNRAYNPFYYNINAYDRANETYTLNQINPETGTETLDYRPGVKEISTASYMEAALNYDRYFSEKHAVSGLLVGILRNSLTANAATLQESLPFRNIGFSGRGSYTYDSRYVVEVNFGYNGSERFHEDKRFGFFPSFGVSWNVSNEKFWGNIKKTISNLKLRATYGIIGNDAIGDDSDRFFYLSQVNLNDFGRRTAFGQEFNFLIPGISVSRYDNDLITWERSKRLNLGFDMTIKDFTISADYSKDNRDNILMNRAFIPTTMGLSAPVRANVGAAKSESFETSLNYTHSFNNSLYINLLGNFTYATNRYLRIEEPQYLQPYRTLVGAPLSQARGYIAERLFVDEQDIKNSPLQTFGEYLPGDIKYRDLNGDGQITPADQIGLGFPTSPEIVYGFGFSIGFKGFDLSSFFNGMARTSLFISPGTTSPFINNSRALLQSYADSHWSEDNRDLYSLWPRLSPNAVTNNQQTSTWFMRNGAFLRLKQVEVGYTLPNKLSSRFLIQKLRVFANGSNLFTVSKFKLWDPELGGSAFSYPVQRVYNFGLQLSF